MNLNIPDNLKGEKRRELLDIYPIVYALWRFKGCLAESAKWLGISRRGLFAKLQKHTELMGFTQKGPKHFYPCTPSIDPLNKIAIFHLERTRKSFWFNQLSEEQQELVSERIMRLYKNLD